MELFLNKIYQKYRIFNYKNAYEFLGDFKHSSGKKVKFFYYYNAFNTVKGVKPVSEADEQFLIGEFDISKAQTATGPLGEIIINEGKKDIYEDIFFKFLNLSNQFGKIKSFDIYSFATRYGLLVNQPLEKNLLNDKYHIEPLSFWRTEIAIMHSLVKTYYNYQNKNIEELKKVFIKNKDQYLYLDNQYSKNLSNNLNPIKISISLKDIISPSGKFSVDEIYEQLFVNLLTNVLNSKLSQSSRTYVIPKERSGEFQAHDQSWIEMKSDTNDLISFIWQSFVSFVYKKTKINTCKNEKCKKYFSSQKFNRAKFHSDICRSAYSRDAKMWEIGQKKLLSKDMLFIKEIIVGIGKIGYFDALILNKKNNNVVAMAELSYSDIDHKSLKWRNMEKTIHDRLQDLNKSHNINHAFLINKNGKIFSWNIKKKIRGEEIKNLPNINDMSKSNLKLNDELKNLIDSNYKIYEPIKR